jgi:hypothetical protein
MRVLYSDAPEFDLGNLRFTPEVKLTLLDKPLKL